MEGREYITAYEAAEILGVSNARVYQFVQQGRLKMHYLYAEDFVLKRNGKLSKEEVEKFKTVQRGVGIRVNQKETSDPKSKVKVSQWQDTHPFGTKRQCADELGITLTTVYLYWVKRALDENDLLKPQELVPKTRNLNTKMRIQSWRAQNPNGSMLDCVFALGISYARVEKYWDTKTASQEQADGQQDSQDNLRTIAS